MHLLHELVCGIRGAESGTADFFRRGTSTRVTYYTSFEGGGATTPSGAVSLDTNGGGEFYVNETTDVVVRDSTGTEVRRFTSAPAASAVEVISPSFTGTDYATGASAASKPVALSTVLDRAFTSFGAVDFNVLYGGSPISMQSLAAKVGTLFFNVKDPDYGATGDGSTDDTAAIQEALDAASTAGGGIVLFPKGTYAVTSLTVPDKVSLLGVGAAASVIALSADTGAGVLVFAASGTYPQTVDQLSLAPSVATTRRMILANNGSIVVIRNCSIGNANHNGIGVNSTHASTRFYAYNTTFQCAVAMQTTGGGGINMILSKVILPATLNTAVVVGTSGAEFRLIGVEFDSSGMTAGTGFLFTYGTSNGAGKGVVIIGCSCADPAGGTLATHSGLGAASSDANGAAEIGNIWGLNVGRGTYGGTGTAGSYNGSMNMDRERRRYYVADDSAAISVGALGFACAEVVRTTNGNQTVTLDGPGPVNADFTLVYHQSAGGASGTITMAGNIKGLPSFTVNATSVSYYHFKAVHRGTSKYWSLVGSNVNQTA